MTKNTNEIEAGREFLAMINRKISGEIDKIGYDAFVEKYRKQLGEFQALVFGSAVKKEKKNVRN